MMTETATQREVPRINDDIIRKCDFGKFVQVFIRGEPYMIFGGGRNHSDLLKLTLKRVGLEFETEMSLGVGIPKPSGKEYNAVGMGRFMRELNNIILCGDSFDYELKPNPEHLEQMKPYLPKDLTFKIT